VLNEKKDIDEMIDREPTKRIIILADQQGRGLREKLQYLTGDEYKVYCFMKPGATLAEVLNSYKPELLNLTDKDIIVVLGGINDRNPELLQIRLNIWLHCVHHTKVIIGEVPYNSFLNVHRLNYLLRFISGRHDNVLYLNWNNGGNYTKLYLAQILLKEILHINYVYKFNQYTLLQIESKEKTVLNKCTQTDITDINGIETVKNIFNSEFTVNKNSESNDLFRV
jgi:hypothetical protein